MSAFEGKTVAITGAAHGIGRAMVLGFAAEGARVAAMDLDGAALEKTCAEAEAPGVQALPLCADLLDRGAMEASFAAAQERFGAVDVLVNNLGQTARERYSAFHEAAHETLDFVLDISLRAALHATRMVIEPMRAQKSGAIINISSDSAFNGDLGTADYAAAKSGLLGFTRTIARENADHNVRANAICPGATNTRAMIRVPKEAIERARAAIPMGQLCEPEDIANAALFLASDKARFITGQTLLVNGGRVFH